MFGRLHRCFGSAIRLGPIRRGSDVLELVFLCKCLECLRGKLCSIISNECMRYSMTAEVLASVLISWTVASWKPDSSGLLSSNSTRYTNSS